MKTCIAAINSMNICIRAQKTLSENGYFSKIISLDPSLTKKGCAYGIEFSIYEERKIKNILRHTNIPVSQYIHPKEE